MLFFLTFSKIVQLQKNQNVQKVEDTSVNIYYTICAIVTLVRELQYEQNDQNWMFRVGCIPSLTLHITAKKIVLRKSFFNSFKVKNTVHKQIFYWFWTIFYKQNILTAKITHFSSMTFFGKMNRYLIIVLLIFYVNIQCTVVLFVWSRGGGVKCQGKLGRFS